MELELDTLTYRLSPTDHVTILRRQSEGPGAHLEGVMAERAQAGSGLGVQRLLRVLRRAARRRRVDHQVRVVHRLPESQGRMSVRYRESHIAANLDVSGYHRTQLQT